LRSDYNHSSKSPVQQQQKKTQYFTNQPHIHRSSSIPFLHPLIPPFPFPTSTSATHTYTHNPAPDTSHASQTNPSHDAHGTHDYTPYKTPSIAPPNPPAPASHSHPLLDPDFLATTCIFHILAFASRNSDTRGMGMWLSVSPVVAGKRDALRELG
jgi:hypothetical protein